jgi:hypothetical protein
MTVQLENGETFTIEDEGEGGGGGRPIGAVIDVDADSVIDV